MSLDATVSGAQANSYVSLAVAQDYLTDHLSTEEWDAQDEGGQEAALVTACRRLDQESYLGTVTSYDQSLQWPRIGVSDRNGRTIASTSIPTAVQYAQCELALALLKDPALAGGSDLTAFDSVTLGSMSVTPRKGGKATLPVEIRKMLAFVLAGGTGIPVFRA